MRRPHPLARARTFSGDRPFVPKIFGLLWLVVFVAGLPGFLNAVSVLPSTDYLNAIQPFATPVALGFGALTFGVMALGAIRRFLRAIRFGAFFSALFAAVAFGAVGAASVHMAIHYTVPFVSLTLNAQASQSTQPVWAVKTLPACSNATAHDRKRTNCIIRTVLGTDALRFSYQTTRKQAVYAPPVFTFAHPDGLPINSKGARENYREPIAATFTGRANWFGMTVETVTAAQR